MVRLDENEPTGSVVLMFTMSDADRFGPASQIGQIFILGSDAQFFNVSATGLNSGVILSKYVNFGVKCATHCINFGVKCAVLLCI